MIDKVNYLESYRESKLLVNCEPFKLPNGFQLKNHFQAIEIVNYHEAKHTGKIFTYLKLLFKDRITSNDIKI